MSMVQPSLAATCRDNAPAPPPTPTIEGFVSFDDLATVRLNSQTASLAAIIICWAMTSPSTPSHRPTVANAATAVSAGA
jgi:hypothetical protein